MDHQEYKKTILALNTELLGEECEILEPIPEIIIDIGLDNTEYFVATYSGIEGCYSQGKTEKEAIANLQEAIMLSLELAHRTSANHARMIQKDKVCSCFECLRIFEPAEIYRWIDDHMGTAICPYCWVDAILGESSGYPITKEFLSLMHSRWFDLGVI